MKKSWRKKTSETFDICDLVKNNTFEAISTKILPKKLLKGKHRLQEWEWLKRLYGIVIRIHTLFNVCLPHCIYCVSFAELRPCADWYKSRFSDGLTSKLLGLQLTYSDLSITPLQVTIMTISRRFPKFLCSITNVSKLRKFRKKSFKR